MMKPNYNDANMPGQNSPMERREHGHENGNSRPYADSRNLYKIPPVRADDPPRRDWWIDDESSDPQESR